MNQYQIYKCALPIHTKKQSLITKAKNICIKNALMHAVIHLSLPLMQDRIFSATKLVAAKPARAITVHLKNSVGKINRIEAGMKINREYP